MANRWIDLSDYDARLVVAEVDGVRRLAIVGESLSAGVAEKASGLGFYPADEAPFGGMLVREDLKFTLRAFVEHFPRARLTEMKAEDIIWRPTPPGSLEQQPASQPAVAATPPAPVLPSDPRPVSPMLPADQRTQADLFGGPTVTEPEMWAREAADAEIEWLRHDQDASHPRALRSAIARKLGELRDALADPGLGASMPDVFDVALYEEMLRRSGRTLPPPSPGQWDFVSVFPIPVPEQEFEILDDAEEGEEEQRHLRDIHDDSDSELFASFNRLVPLELTKALGMATRRQDVERLNGSLQAFNGDVSRILDTYRSEFGSEALARYESHIYAKWLRDLGNDDGLVFQDRPENWRDHATTYAVGQAILIAGQATGEGHVHYMAFFAKEPPASLSDDDLRWVSSNLDSTHAGARQSLEQHLAQRDDQQETPEQKKARLDALVAQMEGLRADAPELLALEEQAREIDAALHSEHFWGLTERNHYLTPREKARNIQDNVSRLRQQIEESSTTVERNHYVRAWPNYKAGWDKHHSLGYIALPFPEAPVLSTPVTSLTSHERALLALAEKVSERLSGGYRMVMDDTTKTSILYAPDGRHIGATSSAGTGVFESYLGMALVDALRTGQPAPVSMTDEEVQAAIVWDVAGSRRPHLEAYRAQRQPREVKEPEPITITEPPTLRYRVQQRGANSGNLLPPVGSKFSDEERASLKQWLVDNGFRPSDNKSVIRFVAPSVAAMDALPDGLGTARLRAEAEKVAEREQAREAREAERGRVIEASPATPWVEKTFGSDFTNNYNKAALVRYLDGSADKFDGLMSAGWMPGLETLGYSADGLSGLSQDNILLRIKRAYDDSQLAADMQRIPAQEAAKRALEIAAVAGHSVALIGEGAEEIERLIAAYPTIGGDPNTINADGDADITMVINPTSEIDRSLPPPAESSEIIRTRVEKAREVLPSVGGFDHAGEELLREAVARGAVNEERARRVAKSIAALDGLTSVRRLHIAEAAYYESAVPRPPIPAPAEEREVGAGNENESADPFSEEAVREFRFKTNTKQPAVYEFTGINPDGTFGFAVRFGSAPSLRVTRDLLAKAMLDDQPLSFRHRSNGRAVTVIPDWTLRDQRLEREAAAAVAIPNDSPEYQAYKARYVHLLLEQGIVVEGGQNWRSSILDGILDAAARGVFNTALSPHNKASRRFFAEITGVELPDGLNATKALFTGQPFPMTVPDVSSQPVTPPGIEGIAPRRQQRGLSAQNVATLLHRLGIGDEVTSGDEFYARVKNGAYLDLVIERHPGEGRYNQLFLTHYVEMGGDLVIDSEMVFDVLDMGRLRLAETATRSPRGEYRDRDTEFANLFSRNLLAQGFDKGELVRSHDLDAQEAAQAAQGGPATEPLRVLERAVPALAGAFRWAQEADGWRVVVDLGAVQDGDARTIGERFNRLGAENAIKPMWHRALAVAEENLGYVVNDIEKSRAYVAAEAEREAALQARIGALTSVSNEVLGSELAELDARLDGSVEDDADYRAAVRDEVARRLAEEAGGLVLALPGARRMGAMISPEPDDTGRWRITWFDERGFSGDGVREGKLAAVRDAIAEGYRDINRNLLRELQQLPSFAEGNAETEAIRRENEERAQAAAAAITRETVGDHFYPYLDLSDGWNDRFKRALSEHPESILTAESGESGHFYIESPLGYVRLSGHGSQLHVSMVYDAARGIGSLGSEVPTPLLKEIVASWLDRIEKLPPDLSRQTVSELRWTPPGADTIHISHVPSGWQATVVGGPHDGVKGFSKDAGAFARREALNTIVEREAQGIGGPMRTVTAAEFRELVLDRLLGNDRLIEILSNPTNSREGVEAVMKREWEKEVGQFLVDAGRDNPTALDPYFGAMDQVMNEADYSQLAAILMAKARALTPQPAQASEPAPAEEPSGDDAVVLDLDRPEMREFLAELEARVTKAGIGARVVVSEDTKAMYLVWQSDLGPRSQLVVMDDNNRPTLLEASHSFEAKGTVVMDFRPPRPQWEAFVEMARATQSFAQFRQWFIGGTGESYGLDVNSPDLLEALGNPREGEGDQALENAYFKARQGMRKEAAAERDAQQKADFDQWYENLRGDDPVARQKEALAAIPEPVLEKVKFALGFFQEADRMVGEGRSLDPRYEAEVFMRVSVPAHAVEAIGEFRRQAVLHGIDADAALAGLGGLPTLAISDKGREWYQSMAAQYGEPILPTKTPSQQLAATLVTSLARFGVLAEAEVIQAKHFPDGKPDVGVTVRSVAVPEAEVTVRLGEGCLYTQVWSDAGGAMKGDVVYAEKDLSGWTLIELAQRLHPEIQPVADVANMPAEYHPGGMIVHSDGARSRHSPQWLVRPDGEDAYRVSPIGDGRWAEDGGVPYDTPAAAIEAHQQGAGAERPRMVAGGAGRRM